MTEKIAALHPCLHSHNLFRLQPPSKDQVQECGGILHLVQRMPTLCHCEEEANTLDNQECRPSFRLIVPSDVDPVSVSLLEPSWFVNVIVTITDRNGCVIYHEAHSSKNAYLRKHSQNFVDIRWGDFIHPLDADIWSQYLVEAFAEADRWRAVRLVASQSPPITTNTGGINVSGNGGSHRRRRASSGGGGGSGGASQPQQQVVSTTSRLSPDLADPTTEEAQKRRFVLSPLYRARWGGLDQVFYFRTVSLPFLRNQNVTSSTTNVFSPTSSFENLLLLNYHCILGKVPNDALSQAVATCETIALDAVNLRVMRKPTDSSPLTRPIAPTAPPLVTTTTASPVGLASRIFFDNPLEQGDEADSDAKFSLPKQSAELYQGQSTHHCQQGDGNPNTHQFPQPPKVQPSPLPVGPHPASYSSAHLAPVDIDWIDQSQPTEHHQPQYQQHQQQHHSGMPPSEVTSTVTRALTMQSQRGSAITMDIPQPMYQQRVSNPPSTSELNKATSQNDRISIFLSLLLPEAIREIREAVKAEPDMVAQRVRAIVTRHLGHEFLSKFFSYPSHLSDTNSPFNYNVSSPLSLPPPLILSTASSTTAASLSLKSHRRTTTTTTEAGQCAVDLVDGSTQQSTPFLLLKQSPTDAVLSQSHKRPSLVQELAVVSDSDSLPPPIFYSCNSSKNDISPVCSASYGLKSHALATTFIPSAQTSGTATPASFDSMTGSSPWMTILRVSQQSAPSLPPALLSSSSSSSASQKHTTASYSSSITSTSSQEVHSTAGVLESLLMGGYVATDSRLRYISGSSTATITTAIATSKRHRNASTGGVSECHQALHNSGPSSACCQAPKVGINFEFETEEWLTFTSSVKAGGCETSPTPANKTGTLNYTPQTLMSPNSSSPCSSLAHLLRHGCPPVSLAFSTVAAIATTASAAVEPLSTSALLAANDTRNSRPTAVVKVPKTEPPRPLDCPLSVIVDSQLSTKNSMPQLLTFTDAEGHNKSAVSPKTQKPKLPLLAPHPMDSTFSSAYNKAITNANGNVKLQNSSGKVCKPNIRDTSEDEDSALASSSLCRLLQGPDPHWETVTTEADAAVQGDTPVAPPPPPASFFELPSDVLVVSGGEGRRTRFDSCSVTLRQPLSVSTPPQVGVSSAPPQQSVAPTVVVSSVGLNESIGGIAIGSNGSDGNCRGTTASPSPLDAMDAGISSPRTAEKNRRAAAAAAAQIAEEAEQQRRQRPSSRHLLERRRLLFQQNVGQIMSYGAGNPSPLESASSHHHNYHHHHQQQPLSNCDCRSCANVPSTSSAAVSDSCNQREPIIPEDFYEFDSTGQVSKSQTRANQRAPLEYFSRQMKEIAPNVRVSPTGYPHHPSLFSVESQPSHPEHQPEQQRQQTTPMLSTYKYSGGHLTPLNYECHNYQPTTPAQGLFTVTPPQYENPMLEPSPSRSSHVPPIQPKLPNHQHHPPPPPNYHPPHHYKQQHLQQQQQPYYHPEPHHQYAAYHQGPSLPQPPPSMPFRVSEAYVQAPDMAYFDPNCSFQQQHHILMQQKPPPPPAPPPRPPNYVSPLCLALQQGQPLPQSQVKANLREKVTNRCQAMNMDAMATGPALPPPPPSPAPPHSVSLVSSAVIGQKRPHPSDNLKTIGNSNAYFYNEPLPFSPTHYNQGFGQATTEIDLPFLNDSTYECYQQQAPFANQLPPPPQRRFTECQSSMLFEPQQYASISEDSSIDNASVITAIYNNGACSSSSSKINEDIQLTADIVNDVLELEAIL